MNYSLDLCMGRPRIVDNSRPPLTVKDYHKLTEDILTSNSRIHRTKFAEEGKSGELRTTAYRAKVIKTVEHLPNIHTFGIDISIARHS